VKVAIYHTTKARLNALTRGIVANGDATVEVTQLADVAVASNWGDAIQLYSMGHRRVAICECGYLGNRNWWCSLSLDGLNGRGIHAEGPERPEPELAPWRGARSGYALILGQVPDDWAVRVALKWPYADWLRETTLDLDRRGYEVRFRQHPYEAQKDRTLTKQPPPLLEELAGARIAVTLNSTSAVEAVCAGVPTVVHDRGCMAWPVSAEYGSLAEPSNRRAWVNRLARLQWSMDELGDGTAWRAIRAVL
jgi:hypothetical protein